MILDDSTIDNLVSAIAEGQAEDARYMESLLMEKKWKTAMNMSSLQADGDLIGYKRTLPQSATGYIVVSHTDVSGANRLANYGTYFYNLDASSDYDNITQTDESVSSVEERHALVPWTCDDTYTVPKGTRFIMTNGTEYISTKDVTSRTLKNAWSVIASSSDSLSEFYEAGGWDGIKYLKIPVIQGIKKQTSIGTTSATRFETLTLAKTNVEAACNNMSDEYFSVHVIYNGTDEEWTEINDIFRAGPYDKVFEKNILKDESGISIKFGDGINGMIPTSGSQVEVSYLETLGTDGDITSKYAVSEMVFPSGEETMTDPRTGNVDSFLSAQNTTSLLGGEDIESVEDFRENAPASYLKSYTISTYDSYLENIKKYSPFNLLHVKLYPGETTDTTSLDASAEDLISITNGSDDIVKVANEIELIKNNINITALLEDGSEIDEDDAEDEFIKPLIASFGDIKGPNDSLTYVAPNKIEIVPSVKVKSTDTVTTESEMSDDIVTQFGNEYNIFNQEFDEPLYKSKCVNLAKNHSYADTVAVNFETAAKVDYDSESIQLINVSNGITDNTLIAIPFSFDKIFATNKYKLGFKNNTVNANYILKVDLSMINGYDDTNAKARTFFLYDNRQDETGDTTLTDGKLLAYNSETKVESAVTPNNIIYSNSATGKIIQLDNTTEDYDSYEVRVAQFPFISKITDDEFMLKAKSFSLQPFENRPYVVDSDGANEVFTTTSVDSDLQVSLAGEGNTVGVQCYKKNEDYIDKVDIIFNEDYANSDSADYANGYFVIPLSYLGFGDNISTSYITNPTAYLTKLSALCEEYLSLRVYAQPKMEDFTPENYNDIVYVDEDYIKVEKESLL